MNNNSTVSTIPVSNIYKIIRSLLTLADQSTTKEQLATDLLKMLANSGVYIPDNLISAINKGHAGFLDAQHILNHMDHDFKVGDAVKLKEQKERIHRCPKDRVDNPTGIISSFIASIEGGVMMKDDLRGCKFWTVEDLEKIIT